MKKSRRRVSERDEIDGRVYSFGRFEWPMSNIFQSRIVKN